MHSKWYGCFLEAFQPYASNVPNTKIKIMVPANNYC